MSFFEQFSVLPVGGGLYDQDPDFIAELQIARMARNDHNLFSADGKNNPELRKDQDRRRVALMRWRRGE